MRRRPATLAFLSAAALGALAGAPAGCQDASGPSAAGGGGGRPMVEVSAADLFSWGRDASSQQLEFYDELANRPIVSQDDAVHAVLLLASGSSALTYEGRLTLAKSRGWLDQSYSPPAREAVTVGEVSQMLARVLRVRGWGSPADATAAMKREGLIPESAEAAQGLTGNQMLAVLSGARDALAETGEMRPESTGEVAAVPTPIEPIAPPPAPATEEPRAEPRPERPPEPAPIEPMVEAPAPAELSGAPRPMPEPLPDVPMLKKAGAARAGDAAAQDPWLDPQGPPLPAIPMNVEKGTNAPAAAPASPPGQGSGPVEPIAAPKPVVPQSPPAQPPAGTTRPGNWVPAKPLRKPIKPGQPSE